MKWLPAILLSIAGIGFLLAAAVGGQHAAFIAVGVIFLIVAGMAARRAALASR